MNFILLLIVALQFQIANAEDLCQGVQLQPQMEKPIPLEDDVNYYLRGSPETGEVVMGSLTGNILVNTQTRTVTKIDGMIDPALSSDGKILARPVDVVFDATQQRFIAVDNLPKVSAAYSRMGDVHYWLTAGNIYEIDDGRLQTARPATKTLDDLKTQNQSYLASVMGIFEREKDGSFKLALNDTDISENYQSLGLLQSGSASKYRILYEGPQAVMYRDYTITSQSGIVANGPPRAICGGDGLAGSLPMISKNGKSFANFDYGQQTMNIYDVDDQNHCSPPQKIPASIGKVDFSPNNRLLAFHIDETASKTGEFATPRPRDHFGVYIWNRDHPEWGLIPIQVKTGEDNYYPVFLSDTKLAYVSATKGNLQHFSLNVVNIKLPEHTMCPGCLQDPQKSQTAGLLGSLYASRCGQSDSSYSSAIAYFSRLNPQSCRALVQSLGKNSVSEYVKSKDFSDAQWNSAQLSKTTPAQLIQICTDVKSGSATATTPQQR